MRSAIVTGASSGIGETIVNRLLAEGWQVTGISRRGVDNPHPHFTSLSVDISDTVTFTAALNALPVPQAIVHAAGMMAAAPLGELDPAVSARLWGLHIHAAEILFNHFAPRMSAGGRLVAIGSRTSRGAAGRSQYVATKAALVGMVRSWAAELAPRGITANVVAPGATQTPMLSAPGREASPPKVPPMGRLIAPEEVAAMVSYLLSAEAAPVTGQELVLCGGASLA
ncbi:MULTISPECIES: SDR family NAD(P)-dependent oxidoreductase [Leclercia]|uniref:SDR family NAD(P)-dependent oxidoreductase n=1 Tax=Leclercia TaxID=83654 RepID=UPI000CD22C18|nr:MULTISPECIES: SDR family oxidoreductase [Leclercia]POV35747.1 oxidoreductase [Leclercia sp. LSNIH5]POW65069.1 oxidoreductase [Leclercia sp. LSNIH2]AUU85456.1 oxidoreductase [Leclercia sp. LSNIH1]MCZ7839351.1 SDR family oxidoreductase [Leclercia adecarboxylata]QGW16990.1 SDR family oxidoreductase [Leclercia sp. Colony189]